MPLAWVGVVAWARELGVHVRCIDCSGVRHEPMDMEDRCHRWHDDGVVVGVRAHISVERAKAGGPVVRPKDLATSG